MADIPVWREIGATTLKADTDNEAEIVIVGGGPVGLTMALDLGLKGRRVTLISALDFIAAGSKAICFSQRTLDIWHRLGVGQAMVEKGVIWNVGKVFCGDASDPLYQFDMLPVEGPRNPGFINLQQYHAEEILIAALSKIPNVEMRWGHEAVAIDRRSDGATLSVKSVSGDYELDAKWVIACDGSRSSIRDMLSLDFEGRIFEDNFLIADVKFKEKRPSERWFWFDPPFNRGKSALLHKQPDDVWRLDFQLGWDIDRKACIKPENVEPFVRGMIGNDVEFTEEWYSVYTFQCRRMKQFVHGRVVFAGDSAHLVSPFGARGCNGGAADIDNLAWKLDAILDGQAPESLIDSYDYEAVVIADENILNSTRSTDFMTPKSAVSEAFRDAVLELAKTEKFARPFVNSGRLSTAVCFPDSILNTPDSDHWGSGIAPGSPALDGRLAENWLLDRLGGKFILLTNGKSPALEGIETLNLSDHEDEGRNIALQYGLENGGAYLIRPDQYVAARWKSPDTDVISDALNRAKGFAK